MNLKKDFSSVQNMFTKTLLFGHQKLTIASLLEKVKSTADAFERERYLSRILKQN